GDVVDADALGRRFLLGPPDAGDLRARDGRVEAAGVAVGHHAVRDSDTGVGPAAHRPGGAEVDVVGMSRDDGDAAREGLVDHPSASLPISRDRSVAAWTAS